MKKNILTVALLMILVAAISIGGTIAWLTAQTGVVTNTFVKGEIEITLDEGDVHEYGETGTTAENLGQHIDEGETRVQANKYQAIPGSTYDKDPIVTVKANSEACYLFVKFEELGNPSTYYTYTSSLTTDNGWTQGTGDIPSNVWYRKVADTNADQEWPLLTGNTIAVKDTVTQSNMTAAAAAKLQWTAYAVQSANVANAETAWGYVPTT